MLAETTLKTDLCVVGGGIAGVCTALAAARNGARVALVQDRSVLGGNASSEIRMHMVGASCSGKRPGARESGIIDELRVEDAVRNPQRSPHLFDLLLYDKVVSEPNITLLLGTACVGCNVEPTDAGKRIAQVHALRNSTEDTFTIKARFFADCSGDGRLGLEAGADWRMGREARHEFSESLAPEQADSHTLGSTILFAAREHDRPMPFVAPKWARRFTEEDLKLRSHSELDFGYWWVEWGSHLDTIKDNAAIRHELLRITLGAWDHIKNHCPRRPEVPREAYDAAVEGLTSLAEQPDPTNWALDWIGFLPGKRESRRLLGPHVLTQHDVQTGRVFEDQVAYGGWWIDLHPPRGVDAPNEYPCAHHPVPHIYSIPLRALFSRNVENLFFAGRDISATHVAFSSTRVMATCGVVGQAVGTAVAVALELGLERAKDLLGRSVITEIQQRLLRDGAFLVGLTNADPDDKARRARVIASDETDNGPATQVLNGVTRVTRPELHPCLPEATNRWTSHSLPAWIELRWDEPQMVSQVQLTFDTGFQRELTLTMSDAYAATMIRGPQPETARDYQLELTGPSGDRVGEPLQIRGNYLGRRVHQLTEPVVASALRLIVKATHAVSDARLFEIRVY